MHCFAVGERDYPQCASVKLRQDSPESYSPVRLDFRGHRLRENPLAPLYLNIGPFAQHLFTEIPGSFHPQLVYLPSNVRGREKVQSGLGYNAKSVFVSHNARLTLSEFVTRRSWDKVQKKYR